MRSKQKEFDAGFEIGMRMQFGEYRQLLRKAKKEKNHPFFIGLRAGYSYLHGKNYEL